MTNMRDKGHADSHKDRHIKNKTFTTPKKCFPNVFHYIVSRIFPLYFRSSNENLNLTAKHLKYFFYFNTHVRKSTPEEQTDNDDFRNTTLKSTHTMSRNKP